jgi:adenosylhomocysteine nucleosidase
MSFETAVGRDGNSRVAIVAALDSECASLRRDSNAPWQVTQSGPGGQRAAAAARRAVAAGARLLLSWGLAGGLGLALSPGVVVIPRRVLAHDGDVFDCDPAWHARVASLADELTTEVGDVLTVPAPLESPESKRAARERFRAVAVDMESAAIARVASEARVPFVALRVVFDGAADALPAGAEQWLDEDGRRRFAPALRAVASPSQWGGLVTLMRRYRVANRALDDLARALVRRRVFAGDETVRLPER